MRYHRAIILLLIVVTLAPLAEANHWLNIAPYRTVAQVSQSQADNGPTGAGRTINKSQAYVWTAGEDVTGTGCTQPLTVQSTLQVTGGDILGVRKDGTVTLSNAGGSFQNVTLLRHVNTSSNNFFFQIQFDINGGVGTTTATQRNTWSGSCASHLPSPWYDWSEAGSAGGAAKICSSNSPFADAIVENTSAIVPMEREKVCFQFAPANSGAIGWLQYVTESPNPPQAPTLSGIVTGLPLRSVLTWTTPSAGGAAIQGYNVTMTNEYGTVTITNLGIVNTFSDMPGTQNRTYTVHAWNQYGNSTESNLISLKLPTVPLYGPNGALYGGDRTALASALSVPPAGLDLLYGLLLVVLFTGFGVILVPGYRIVGAVIGAVAGLFIAIAFGMIPLYAVLFLLVVVGAVFYLVRSRSGGTGGE